MAQTLDVQLINENARTQTLKLDNPKSNLTKNDVINAFNIGISNGVYISNDGTPIIRVGEVVLTTSTKVVIQGETVTFTPEKLNINGTLSSQYISILPTVEVANGTPQGVSITNLQYTERPGSSTLTIYAIIQDNNNTVEVNIIRNKATAGNYQGTFNLNIVVLGIVTTIPATFNVNVSDG